MANPSLSQGYVELPDGNRVAFTGGDFTPTMVGNHTGNITMTDWSGVNGSYPDGNPCITPPDEPPWQGHECDGECSSQVVAFNVRRPRVSIDIEPMIVQGGCGSSLDAKSEVEDGPIDENRAVISPNWSIVGDNLGCSIVAHVEATATIIPGSQEGTITIRASWSGFQDSNGQSLHIDRTVRIALPNDGAGCSSGNCGDGAGSGVAKLRGVDFRIALGHDKLLKSFGELRILGEGVATAMGTPAALMYGLKNDAARGLQVSYASNGSLNQILTPSLSLLVTTLTPSSYQTEFFRRDSNGQPASTPFVVWGIAHSSSNGGTLVLTKKIGGFAKLGYEYHTSADELILETSDGNSASSRQEHEKWLAIPGGTQRQYWITDASSEGYREYEDYQDFGGGFGKQKTRSAVYPAQGSEPLETLYGYYDNTYATTPGRSNQLRYIRNADGSWKWHTYDSFIGDGVAGAGCGRITTVASSWKDLAVDFSGYPNQNSEVLVNGRHTDFNYDPPQGSGDDQSLLPRRPRRVDDVAQGKLIGRTYYAFALSGTNLVVTEKRCNRQNAGYGEPGNLTTVTTYVGMDETRPLQVIFPDGRIDSYNYETGNFSFAAGQSPSFTPSVNGLFQRVQIARAGTGGALVANKSTRSDSVRDADGRTVLEATDVYTGSDWAQVAWTVRTHDDFGHILNTYGSDDTVTDAVWGCCGQTSYTDETGIQTLFDPPDALGRVSDITKAGIGSQEPIHTHYDFDVMGRVTHTLISSGGLQSESFATYDWAGRVQSTTDSGLTTTYEYCTTPSGSCGPSPIPTTLGCRRTEVNLPGGATQVTENCLDGRVRSVTGTAVVAKYYQYGVEDIPIDSNVTVSATYRQVIIASPTSPRYEKTWHDMLGRQVRQDKPGLPNGTVLQTNWYYDASGRMQHVSTNFVTTTSGSSGGGGGSGAIENGDGGDCGTTVTTTEGTDTWYDYDVMSNIWRTGLKFSSGTSLDPASTDRITETETNYVLDGGCWWLEKNTYAYPTNGVNEKFLASRQKHKITGLSSGVTSYAESTDSHELVTKSSRLVNRGTKTVTEVTDMPLSSLDAVTVAVNGLLQTSQTNTGVLYTYGYDDLGRQTQAIDPRTGTTFTFYVPPGFPNAGRVDHVIDAAGKQTTYGYNSHSGRLESVTNHSGKKAYYEYNDRDQIVHVWGDVPQPLEMVYDEYGQRTNLKTYRDPQNTLTWNGSGWPSPSDSMADITTWTYDAATGLVTDKRYADFATTNKKVIYTYTKGGALKTRTWARKTNGATGNPIVTTYDYDNHSGELTSIAYSGTSATTPSISQIGFTYDRLGRRKTATQACVTSYIFTYDGLDREPVTEEVSGLYSKMITRHSTYPVPPAPGEAPPPQPPPAGHELGVGTAALPWQDYDAYYVYGDLGRLSLVAGPGLGTAYAEYGYVEGSSLIERLDYKASATTTLSSTTRGYEPNRDLITSVENKWGSETVSNYAYHNDNLGRRDSVVRSGSAFSQWQLETWDYNDRNELTKAWLWAEDPEDPGPGQPLYVQDWAYEYDNIGNRKTSSIYGWTATSYTANNLNQYTATSQPSEPFGYDLDGNLTSDATYSYIWDGENRLRSVAPTTPVSGSKKLEFLYDYMGRRVAKKVSTHNGTAWTLNSNTYFVYDGWNLILELDGLSNYAVLRKYTWGLDLSGSLQGAGGIGGLLAMQDLSGFIGLPSVNYAYFYDANGNVGQLINIANGVTSAVYEYDPYGNAIIAGGSAAVGNPFCFSTKYRDRKLDGSSTAEDLYYYDYRHYLPRLGRWANRDPFGELGAETLLRKAIATRTARRGIAELLPEGPNLYGFVHNNPISFVDADGRAIPPAVVAALAVLAAVEACAYPQSKAAFNRYPDSGDKFKHCWVSCRISKSCGGLITELAGLGKEVRDRAVAVYCDYFPNNEICQGGHGDFWDSVADLKANQQCVGWESLVFGAPGGWVGALCRQSCEDCCKAKVGYNTGER